MQGSLTKTGNGHARRLLVEAAWHHRARYVAGAGLRQRWELATPAARARGDLGNRRLLWLLLVSVYPQGVYLPVQLIGPFTRPDRCAATRSASN